jgi:hypothetical protein
LNAAVIDADDASGRARSIQRISLTRDALVELGEREAPVR